MDLALIAAISDNNVLGKQNKLIWHLPDDWNNFREITGDAPFIMGRKSYESEDRLLSPGENYVLTSKPLILPEPNCKAFTSYELAIKELSEEEIVFVTGGASVYKQCIDKANLLYLTLVHHEFRGDAFFPEINWEEWEELDSIYHPKDDEHAYDFHMNEYERKSG
ncbi:MAG: dihydrofolate reductase [Limisphaerales bacterium]|jgi:dihydrofolate reductase